MNYGVALNAEVPKSSTYQNQIEIFEDLGPKYFGQDYFENVSAQHAVNRTRKWRNFSRRNDIGGHPELSEKFHEINFTKFFVKMMVFKNVHLF